MSDKPKFCADCKHYKPATGAALYGTVIAIPAQCFAIEEYNLESGYRIGRSPSIMRAHDACGGDGKLWEAKS